MVPSNLFFFGVVVELFDYFWKPNSLFSKFCVNCLFKYYFVYCNKCVLKDFNGACYCTCSLVALRVPEMCFWPAKTGKILEVFEMLSCLWPGAQMWFGHKWRKLNTASLLLHCFGGYSCLCCWNEFFSAEFQVLGWRFLVLHIDGNVCNWIPKVIWPRMDWICGFLLEMASLVDFISVWTEGKNCSIVILFWRHLFFRCLGGGVFRSVLWKCFYFLAIGFCIMDW